MALAALALAACKDVTHERIEHWQLTERGPARLEEALADPDLGVELRAHAAQALVALQGFSGIRDTLQGMEEGQRHEVVRALAPRLWEDARLEGRMARPTGRQAEAKDALFELRELADPETTQRLDEYLLEWLTGGYYEGRAGSGRISGKVIVRAIGEEAATPLLAEARRIIVKPADESGRRLAVGDRLLAGLAVAGSPEAVAFLLDLVTGDDRGDETLPIRTMDALEAAYAEPVGVAPAPPEALRPHVERLLQIPQRSDVDGGVKSSAVRLIAAAGPPHCIEPLAKLAGMRHDEEALRWMAAQQGVRCGGAEALDQVVRALPEDERYRRGILEKYVWKEAMTADPAKRVAKTARALLSADSWVARGTGVELLGLLAIEATAAADAERVLELSGDATPLRGWEDGRDARSPRDPTVSERAAEVARALEKVAK